MPRKRNSHQRGKQNGGPIAPEIGVYKARLSEITVDFSANRTSYWRMWKLWKEKRIFGLIFINLFIPCSRNMFI